MTGRRVLTARQSFRLSIEDPDGVSQKQLNFPGLLYALEFAEQWLKDRPNDIVVMTQATELQMVQTGVPVANQ